MEVEVGSTLAGRYDILAYLGGGGMGDVFRARDRELDEIVALKVIRADVARHPELLDRFRREVKLARRVTHRNVARVFELGREHDILFCTMELIDGESIARRLLTARKLPIGEAATIASALCDALETAHAAGVIHRDIKPDNAMLATDGRVVLTDFGIAGVRHGIGDIGGTPRYMAPEQARGEPPTPVADVYALGVMLFEMVAGRPAFAGEPASILRAKQHAAPLVTTNDGLEPALAELIRRATEPDPARRLPSARALREGLAAWAHPPLPAGPITARRATLADVPTVIVHPPRVDEDAAPHLAEAFHHALLELLSRRPRLRVILRPADSPHVEEGTRVTLDATGPAITVTARSPEAAALSLQLPIDPARLHASAATAARTVGALVPVRAEAQLAREPLPPEALDLYEQARHLARTRGSFTAASELFAVATRLAPGDPRIITSHAMTDIRRAFFADKPAPELVAAATARVRAALAAAPDLAEAHLAYGHVSLHAGDAATAVAHFRAAIARAPFLVEAHAWLGTLLLEAGHVLEGTARAEDTLAMSPQLEAPLWDLMRIAALEGRWHDVAQLKAKLESRSAIGPRYSIWMRIASWRDDRATLTELRDQLAARTSEFERLVTAACSIALERTWGGRRDQFYTWMTGEYAIGPRRRAFLAQVFAEAGGWAGSVDDCITGLEVADAAGLFDLSWLDGCPSLDLARADPRFAVVRAHVKARSDAIHDALYGDRTAESRPPSSGDDDTLAAAL